MAPSPTRQLDDADAIFLSMESPEAGGHVGALTILDPSSNPRFDFDHLAGHIAERVSLVPRFSWKLHTVPLGMDRPYWVEAPDFDPRSHVIRTAVPAPGSAKQVTALASRLHAQPMDRSRPLWEIWCIEGLEGGKVALYMKTHHCLVDGTGGAGLGEVLADLTPDATAPPMVPEAFLEETPVAPSTIETMSRAMQNGAERPRRLASHLGRGIRQIARGLREKGEEGTIGEVERFSFNRSVSRRRALATTSLEFERVRDLKKHFDVKVNDVVLEIVGSAMRRWLRNRGETPTQPLVVMCPVSTRPEDEKGLGNQITSMAVALPTDEPDPVERLRLIHASSKRAKEAVSKGNFDWIAALGESFNPATVQLLIKATGAAGDSGPLPANFVVSNVRTAPIPLYLGGAKVESMMPMSMLAVGQGLNVTVVSYCDRIDVGIIVDPELVPDAWEIAEQFPAALEELEAAAEGVIYSKR
jgi:WS/DGAT/MGAT family acyltransferase